MRCQTHLRLFAQRLLKKEMASEDVKVSVYEQLLQEFPEEEACLEQITEYIRRRFRQEIPLQEKLYLVLHLQRLYSRK